MSIRIELDDNSSPKFIKHLIGKPANITTTDKETHHGTVHVIDPISKTIVLLRSDEIGKKLTVVMAHAVSSFEMLQDDSNAPRKDFASEEVLFEKDVEERRVRLGNWFRKNRVEFVDEEKVLKVHEGFSIGPPYTVSQCVCANKTVLERMIQLIEKMP